jgi:hypothetical protein
MDDIVKQSVSKIYFYKKKMQSITPYIFSFICKKKINLQLRPD